MPSQNGTDNQEQTVVLDMEDVLYTELNDENFAELAGLEGSMVVGVSFWDSSIADDLDAEPPSEANRTLLDLDVYLDDNVLLELFGSALYRSPEEDPLVGMEAMEAALVDLVDSECTLDEVAETEDGGPVLVFAVEDQIKLIISVGAWAVSDYEELPDEEEE